MSENKKHSVGGQALMEGVMMQGPEGTAMALRLPDGKIETQLKKVTLLRDKYKFFRIPFIRGPVNFVEQMIFGYKCLMESAEKTTVLEDDGEDMSKLDKWLTDHFGPKMMAVIGVISMVIALVIGFFLFMWLPSFVADLILGEGSNTWKPAIEGVMRIIIFITYMYLTSLMKDIKRLFMYHGAEHKSIFCYEKGLELTVENVKKQKRFHPRCGTSFIFLTLIVSIVISTTVVVIWPWLRNEEMRWLWMGIKILILPLIMSVGYEMIRLAGKYDNIFTRIISAPGTLMQRITTKEPTDDIIEVGIASLKVALGIEKENINEISEEAEVENNDD